MAKEIWFCNLTVLHKNKKVVLKEVVYKETDGFYHKKKLFDEPVKVINVEIIKVLGHESTSKSFDVVKKSDEQRDSITGSYQ
jgi:hypothetical protein